MSIVSAIFRVLVGIVFGVAAMLALTPAFAAIVDPESGQAGWAFVVVVLSAVLAFFAPTMRRAFGRGFLLLGAAVMALPLSTMLLSGKVAGEMADKSGDAATLVGAGIAGAAMTGVAAFIGFFLGAILLIVGLVLVLGGRREVVVVTLGAGSGE